MQSDFANQTTILSPTLEQLNASALLSLRVREAFPPRAAFYLPDVSSHTSSSVTIVACAATRSSYFGVTLRSPSLFLCLFLSLHVYRHCCTRSVHHGPPPFFFAPKSFLPEQDRANNPGNGTQTSVSLLYGISSTPSPMNTRNVRMLGNQVLFILVRSLVMESLLIVPR